MLNTTTATHTQPEAKATPAQLTKHRGHATLSSGSAETRDRSKSRDERREKAINAQARVITKEEIEVEIESGTEEEILMNSDDAEGKGSAPEAQPEVQPKKMLKTPAAQSKAHPKMDANAAPADESTRPSSLTILASCCFVPLGLNGQTLLSISWQGMFVWIDVARCQEPDKHI